MFGFGVCIGTESKYAQWAARGIAEVREPDTKVFEVRNQQSIFSAYNHLLDMAQAEPGLEGLVLIHEDVLIRDRDCLPTLRRHFTDETVGLVGVYGCQQPRRLSWHTEARTFGYVEEPRFLIAKSTKPVQVDVLDGLFLALSPRAVRTLRFDEARYSGWHGYDADICVQARSAGLKVLTDQIDVYHATKGSYGNRTAFLRTDLIWRAKWRGSPFLSPSSRTWDTVPGIRQIADSLTPVTAAVSKMRHQAGAWRADRRLKG